METSKRSAYNMNGNLDAGRVRLVGLSLGLLPWVQTLRIRFSRSLFPQCSCCPRLPRSGAVTAAAACNRSIRSIMRSTCVIAAATALSCADAFCFSPARMSGDVLAPFQAGKALKVQEVKLIHKQRWCLSLLHCYGAFELAVFCLILMYDTKKKCHSRVACRETAVQVPPARHPMIDSTWWSALYPVVF